MTLWFPLKKYVVFSAMNRSNLKRHFRENLIYFIPTIAATVFNLLDKCMLGWIGKSNFDNGYYEQAFKIYQMVAGILNSFSVVLLPRMAYLWANKQSNYQEIHNIISKAFKGIGLLSFPMAVGVFCIAPKLVPVFLGEDYDPCILLIQIFSIMIVVSVFNNILGQQCLISRGKQKEYNISIVVGAIINIFLNIICITLAGANGAAIASVISELVVISLLFYYSRDVVSFVEILKAVYKYIICSAIMGSMILIVSSVLVKTSVLNLVLEILLGFTVYFLMMLLIKDEVFEFALNSIKRNREDI